MIMKAVLSSIKYLVHDLEHRYIYEKPSHKFRTSLLKNLSINETDKLKRDFEALDENGLLCLPDYFSDITPSLKKEFEGLIINHSTRRGLSAGEDNKVNIGHFSISNEGLADSDYVSLAAVNKYLTLLVSYYWGKQVYLAQVGGTRLEPSDIKENYRSMLWHHDTKHKQLKIFI